VIPEQVEAWGERPRSTVRSENSRIVFRAERGGTVEFTYKRRTVDCGWRLLKAADAAVVAEGRLAGKDKASHAVAVELPEDGNYIFDPGNAWPYGCAVELTPPRPHAWRGGNMTAGIENPVYFYVPPETESFVLRYNGYGVNRVQLTTSDGKAILASDRVLPADEIPVIVPQGAAGRIWQVAFTCIRAGLRLYDVPNVFAATPSDLMIPEKK